MEVLGLGEQGELQYGQIYSTGRDLSWLFSALEITTKFCDAEFARKAKAADFLGRIWDVFAEAGAGRGEDKVYLHFNWIGSRHEVTSGRS